MNEGIFVTGALLFILSGITLSLMYLYIRSKYQSFLATLKTNFETIRRVDRELSEIKSKTIGYSIDDPEPFGNLTKVLSTFLIEIDAHLKKTYDLYSQIKTSLGHLTHSRGIIYKEIPSKIKSLFAMQARLNTETRILTEKYQRIEGLVSKLHDLGWFTACQARKLFEMVKDTNTLIDDLIELNYDDEELRELRNKINNWETTLQTQIPAFFFSNNRDLVDKEADRASISKTFQIITPAIKQVNQLYDHITAQFKNINEIDRLLMGLQGNEKKIRRIMDEIRMSPIIQINWNVTGPKLDNFQNQITAIHKENAGFSGIKNKLYSLQTLFSDWKILLDNVEISETTHRQLEELVSHTNLDSLNEWSRNAAERMLESGEFDKKNWDKVIELDVLDSQISTLSSVIKSMQKVNLRYPIKESDLFEFFTQYEQLLTFYKDLKPSFDLYFKQLTDIKRMASEAKQSLINIEHVIQQISVIVKSNPFLDSLARKELNQSIHQLEGLNKSINHTQEGLITKKYEQTLTYLSKFQTKCTEWNNKLDSEVRKQMLEIAQKVDAVQNMVSLSDPVFVDIVNLEKDFRTVNTLQLKGNHQISLLDITRLLRDSSKIWQRTTAARKTVTDIVQPILERSHKLEVNRDRLKNLKSESDSLIPEILKWPPTTQRLSLERKEYSELENQYFSVKKTHYQAVKLIALLSDLSDHYLELSTKFEGVIKTAKQEQMIFKKTEQDLEKSKSLWVKRVRENDSNLLAVEEIQELIDLIESDYEIVKSRYETGQYQYHSALRALRLLRRKIDESTVFVEPDKIMDINGETKRLV